MHVEHEAKFLWTGLTSPDDLVVDCLRAAGAEVSTPHRRELTDIYLDTPGRDLMNSGWAFRFRVGGGDRMLGLKSHGTRSGAVQSREEFEQPSENPPGNFAELPDGPVSDRIRSLIPNPDAAFEPLIEIGNHRTQYGIDFGELKAELAVDHVSMDSDSNGALRYTEIELEWVRGSENAFRDLVGKLGDVTDLLPARMGKFERGIQFAFHETCPSPGHIKHSHSRPNKNFARYVADYLGQQSDLAFAFEDLAWEGVNPRGVHQMRVATRRFRSTLSACRFALPEGSKEIGRVLKVLADVLGRIRDLDVFLPRLRGHISQLPPSESTLLGGLGSHLLLDWTQSRRELIAYLSGSEYRGVIRSVPDFIDTCRSKKHRASVSLSNLEAAGELLPKRLLRIRTLGDSIDPDRSTDEELHRLRIKAKRLRYLADLFTPVFGKPLAHLAAESARVQDLLGEHQDACFELIAIRDFSGVASPSGATSAALEHMGGKAESIRIASRRAFPAAWEQFIKSSCPEAICATLC